MVKRHKLIEILADGGALLAWKIFGKDQLTAFSWSLRVSVPKMKKDTRTYAVWLLLILVSISSCTVPQQTIEHSFKFLDKWGMVTGYELQYFPQSRTPLENDQKEKLFLETERIASAYGREITLTDFYFKRDSIEKQFTIEVIQRMKKNEIEIKDISIVNLMVNKRIAEALSQRATALKESQPTRIKIMK